MKLSNEVLKAKELISSNHVIVQSVKARAKGLIPAHLLIRRVVRAITVGV